MSRHLFVAVLVAAIAVSVVGVFAGTLQQRLSQTQGAEGPPEGLDSLGTSEVIWDLEFDTERGELWFVIGNGKSARIARLSVDEGEALNDLPTREWSLPPGEYSGIHREIRVLESGRVAVTEDYSVVVLDPSSGAMAEARFSLEVDGALPGALEADSPLPGTWVSAIDVAGNNVYVARNNVPYLTVLDASTMKEVDRVALDAERAGAHDVIVTDRGIWLKSASEDIISVSTGGPLTVAAEDILAFAPANGDGFVGTGRRGEVFVGGPRASIRVIATERSLVAVAANPPSGLIAFDRDRGELIRYDAETGAEMASVALPKREVPSRMGNPPVMVPPNILDLAVDSSGHAWYSVGDDPTLYRLELP